MIVIKRDKTQEEFDYKKVIKAMQKAFDSCNHSYTPTLKLFTDSLLNSGKDSMTVEEIQDEVIKFLIDNKLYDVVKSYIIYKEKRTNIREFVKKKKEFINKYKVSSNTANATIDDNSNVCNKNIGILNAEIHKEDNIEISRGMLVDKLRELYPDFDSKQYIKDLNHHIIYKHDESSFAGAIAPYCCSITMYPFLLKGIKGIGGLSASPKNLDSFCGMYINLIFATSAMFAGAIATSEFFVYFDYFSRKEWGDEYFLKQDAIITTEHSNKKKTILSQIHQHFQQIIYSINQPAAARGMQSAFVNFSYFDKAFFDGMFGNFYFPDGTQPQWESVKWLQQTFMKWFNEERLKTIITFPVNKSAA
jgi:ribonucleoside-triphosphate reductase